MKRRNQKRIDKNLKTILNLEAVGFSRRVLGRKRIAILDDDVNQLNLIQNYLFRSSMSDDIELSYWSDPVEALSELIHWDYDLIIIDINLPQNSGFLYGELISSMHAFAPSILYMSSDGKYSKEFRKYQNTNALFMKKPFSQTDFLDKVCRMIS